VRRRTSAPTGPGRAWNSRAGAPDGPPAGATQCGEQQRVAIARALINQPSLILADEPTGNLDSQSGAEVMALFQQLNRQEGVATVVITHDHDVASVTARVVEMKDGEVVG